MSARLLSPLNGLAAVAMTASPTRKRERFNSSSLRHNLPYEGKRVRMKELIRSLPKSELGSPVTHPVRIGSLQPLRLSSVGEPQRDAYYDVVKRHFFLRQEGRFYGPFPVPVG